MSADRGGLKLALALLGALAFAALPLLTSSNYIIGVGISALIFTVAAAALNLVYGFTGLLSFAQLGFWGIGGYVATLTVMTFGGNFWLGVVYAALLNAALALVIGYPILRTNRHAFVISTLTFALLVALIALFPPYIMWLPNAIWKSFDLFVGAIQAFIFSILTVLYFSQAMEMDEGHD